MQFMPGTAAEMVSTRGPAIVDGAPLPHETSAVSAPSSWRWRHTTPGPVPCSLRRIHHSKKPSLRPKVLAAAGLDSNGAVMIELDLFPPCLRRTRRCRPACDAEDLPLHSMTLDAMPARPRIAGPRQAPPTACGARRYRSEPHWRRRTGYGIRFSRWRRRGRPGRGNARPPITNEVGLPVEMVLSSSAAATEMRTLPYRPKAKRRHQPRWSAGVGTAAVVVGRCRRRRRRCRCCGVAPGRRQCCRRTFG